MKHSFVGRDRELAALEETWSGPGGALVPVYGRRRVGKSELILQFLRTHPGVYYVGKQASAALQIRELLQAAADALGEPLLASAAVDGWGPALDAITRQWRGPGKLVLALDEFQWMVEASPELPSLLQERWDRRWRDDGTVMLVLCGSYVGFMEREVLGQKSPLFGRRTRQIHLQPFGFREAREFHPTYSLVDAARTWFVCGGVPLYLQAFDEGRSVEQNLQKQLLDEFGPLYREPDFLLREELREVQTYYGLLMALSSGSATLTDLAKETGIPARSLPYYLDRLIDLRYVRRRHPLTGQPPSARQVRFVLDDPLLRFWFRFVWPNTSLLAARGPDQVFAQKIRPQLDAYFVTAFEGLCREALPLLYVDEGVTAPWEVGEYWGRDVQIDVVGVREDGWTDLGECKWGAVGSREAVARELAERAAKFPNGRGATVGLRVFAREGAPAGPGGVRWHDLAALYGEGE